MKNFFFKYWYKFTNKQSYQDLKNFERSKKDLKIFKEKFENEINKIQKKIKTRFSKGDVVLLLIENSIEAISTYIGVFDLPIVKIIIDANISHDFYLDLKKKYKPNYILCSKLKMQILSIKNYEYLNFNFCV